MLQLLAVSGWFQVMQVTNGSALLALGSPRSVAVANMVKLAAMVIFVPVGFWTYGLLGGIVGIILSDALKYAASSVAARRKGLHMLAKDLMLSLMVAATAVAALAIGDWTRRFGTGWRGEILALGVVMVFTCAAWGPVVWYSLRSRKAVS
jgi:O-antigen/teichoic acid export membrane protein